MPFILVAMIFGVDRGGKIIFSIIRLWAYVWFTLVGIRWRIIRSKNFEHKHESYIYVANHASYLDAAIMFLSIKGQFRALGKVEMKKIPIFGFLYDYVAITVDRSSKENRQRSVRLLRYVLRKDISIVIFPEGTFNMTNKPLIPFYDGAFRISIDTETPIVPIVFKGVQNVLACDTWFKLNPGKITAVYLETQRPNGYTQETLEEYKQKIYRKMEEALDS